MKMVYVAGPYSAPTYLEREQNTLIAKKVAAELARNHIGFFCPHMNSAHFDEAVGEVLGHEYWLALDFRILTACDAIYMIPGWEKSVGSQAEWAEAARLRMRRFTKMEELLEWATA